MHWTFHLHVRFWALGELIDSVPVKSPRHWRRGSQPAETIIKDSNGHSLLWLGFNPIKLLNKQSRSRWSGTPRGGALQMSFREVVHSHYDGHWVWFVLNQMTSQLRLVKINLDLTHFVLITPYGDLNLGQHWLRSWFVAWLHQAISWNIVDYSSNGWGTVIFFWGRFRKRYFIRQPLNLNGIWLI